LTSLVLWPQASHRVAIMTTSLKYGMLVIWRKVGDSCGLTDGINNGLSTRENYSREIIVKLTDGLTADYLTFMLVSAGALQLGQLVRKCSTSSWTQTGEWIHTRFRYIQYSSTVDNDETNSRVNGKMAREIRRTPWKIFTRIRIHRRVIREPVQYSTTSMRFPQRISSYLPLWDSVFETKIISIL
jgi:hypothetical protein